MKKALIGVFAIAMACQSTYGHSSQLSDLQTLQTKMEETVTEGYKALSVPGISVGIVLENGDEVTAFSGIAVTGTDEYVNEDHRFRLASISKHLTAITLMTLMEQGEFALDDLISDYLDLPLVPNAETITIRQLLDHSAGVYDHVNGVNDFFSKALSDPQRVWQYDEILQYANDNGASFSPGTAYGYSNMGYLILGMLIESITEKTLAQAFDDLLLNPLSLTDVFVDDFSTSAQPIERLAENSRSYEYHMSAVGAAGNFVAAPIALARLGHEVYVNDFITDESESILNTPSANNAAYGIGTRLWSVENIFHFGHTGTLGGYRSIFMYLPDQKANIVISVNGYPSDSSRWWTFIDEVFLDVVNYNNGTLQAPDNSTDETPSEDTSEEDEQEEPVEETKEPSSGGAVYLLLPAFLLILRRTKA